MGLSLLSLLLTFSPARSQMDAWREQGNDRVKVFYHGGDFKNVSDLLADMQRDLPRLESSLGIQLRSPARIYLVTSEEEFDRITGGILPVWSQGVSFPETGSIVLKSPRFSQDVETLRRTALHEMVHVLIARKVPSGVPRWLNEGLALVLSGEGVGKPLAPLTRAIWTNGLLSLREVEQVDNFSHRAAELAYMESFQAVQYFIQAHGWDAMRRMLARMGAGLSWDEALYQEAALDHAGFEAAWLDNLNQSYRWMIFLNIESLLILGATGLILAAYISMKRRSKRTIKRWAAEEGPTEGFS